MKSGTQPGLGEQLGVLVTISVRNIASHKAKSLIVGFILAFGTFLVVLGTSLLDSIESAMTRSITSSMSGHLQVYDARAQDELALFGGMTMGGQDIGQIDDFKPVRETLEAHPNVKGVVPMGIGIATILSGNETDDAIGELRRATGEGNSRNMATSAAQVRQIAALLDQEYRQRLGVMADRKSVEENLGDIAQVLSDDFLAPFLTPDPSLDAAQLAETREKALFFLDTKIAPLSSDGRLLYLRYLGTDLERFRGAFESFRMVRGELVPPGKRGMLLSHRTAERYLKNRVARELDALKRSIEEDGKSIEGDPLLESQVRQLVKQYGRVVFSLKPDDARDVEQKLRGLLPGTEGDLAALVQAFLQVNDANFSARYAFFYEHIAPHIRMYAVDVGDVITLQSFTKSGYIRSVNVKIYGAFSFTGLETSDLAGAANLIDMMTFRDLYGEMSAEQRAELAGMRDTLGVEDIAQDDIESALFGEEGEVELPQDVAEGAVQPGAPENAMADTAPTPESAPEAPQAAPTEAQGGGFANQEDRLASLLERIYPQDATDSGLVLNAAILLRDPERLAQTRAELEAIIAEQKLGLKVVDWQKASGIVGQFITVIRVVLYIAIAIIFLVALVIINNSMVMATLERTGEIGTMRAIGAQRRFVMLAFLIETLLLGLAAGAVGALLGTLAVLYLGQVGIPAVADVLVFLFSGRRLYPDVGIGNAGLAVGIIAVVSLLSTFYPAFVATRIQPITAMRAKD